MSEDSYQQPRRSYRPVQYICAVILALGIGYKSCAYRAPEQNAPQITTAPASPEERTWFEKRVNGADKRWKKVQRVIDSVFGDEDAPSAEPARQSIDSTIGVKDSPAK